jgi:hypothetical protein
MALVLSRKAVGRVAVAFDEEAKRMNFPQAASAPAS